MYDIEEEIIDKLEEIDITFNNINSILESIKSKITKTQSNNKQIIVSFQDFFNLFDITKEQPTSFILEKDSLIDMGKNSFNESKIYNYNENRDSNPFDSSFNKSIEEDENENATSLDSSFNNLIKRNKSFEIPNEIQTEIINESKKVKHCDNKLLLADDLSSSLIKIDEVEFPSVFKSDKNLFRVYKFIKEEGSIKYKKLIDHFKEIDYDTLEIYIQLFISKRLVCCKNGVLSV
ncbi:hypothetical protein CDIK_0502 [Cucumispora dikerogammari]|nr:hypothetical protein CDIK_0502 [Cucumispora dikerogammari]